MIPSKVINLTIIIYFSTYNKEIFTFHNILELVFYEIIKLKSHVTANGKTNMKMALNIKKVK